MGKRKMAYLADPQAPMFGSRDIGSWLGSMQELSWRWRPPTSAEARANQKDTVLGLPPWLTGWLLGPHSRPDIEIDMPKNVPMALFPSNVHLTEEVLTDFRRMLFERDNTDVVHAQFNHYLQEGVIVGAVDEELIRQTLSFVTDAINASCQSTGESSSRRMDFYQAVWEGLLACRVVHVQELQPSTMDLVLTLIAELPYCESTKKLVQRILAASSSTQLDGMTFGIVKVVKSWAFSKSKMASTTLCEQANQQSQQYILHLSRKVNALKAHLEPLASQINANSQGTRQSADLLRLQNVLEELQEDMRAALRAIKRQEDLVFPIRSATRDLVECLKPLSAQNVAAVMQDCLKNWLSRFSGAEPAEPNYLITILIVAAQLPKVDRLAFVSLWQAAERGGFHINDTLGSELLLLRMVTNGRTNDDLPMLRNHFEIGTNTSSTKIYKSLLDAVLQYRVSSGTVDFVIETLRKLEKHESIVEALLYVSKSSKIPSFTRIRRAILASNEDSGLALALYKAYFPARFPTAQFNHSRHPGLLMNLIQNPRIPPADIWRTFGRNDESDSSENMDLSHSRLPLVLKMAEQFAISSARPQRVAFRNVTKCVTYFHKYQVPIPWELSRAVVYAGATREVMRENWIGKERMKWILSIVERGEGIDVAREVEVIVNYWMERLAMENENKRITQRQLNEARAFALQGRKVSR
jgi:hypothetical protein